MDFIPQDSEKINEMLQAIGINSLEDLFKDIPDDIKLKELEISNGLSEPDLLKNLQRLSQKNYTYTDSFLGAGCYYHYIPAIVDFIISRSEFFTSYTPYQAEASQGFLQAQYEYQTAITRLTKMDISNASMYDGSTALAEAALISSLITRKNKIVVIEGIHPEYYEVLATYCWAQDIEIDKIKLDDLKEKVGDNIASVIIQSPNFFGEIENLEKIIADSRKQNPNALIIQVMTDATCLGILKPPGDFDVDIFIAEGQALGINPNFGGSGLGIFATKNKFLRKIPGRLVGKTKEIHGEKTGYVLTLQTREQHIRREKAISNICTNQSLCALASLIYLVSMGESGLKEIARQNILKSHYLKEKLAEIPGYDILNTKPTYNEFLLKCPNIKELIVKCKKASLLPPLSIENYFPKKKNVALVCVTERNSIENLKKFIEIAKASLT